MRLYHLSTVFWTMLCFFIALVPFFPLLFILLSFWLFNTVTLSLPSLFSHYFWPAKAEQTLFNSFSSLTFFLPPETSAMHFPSSSHTLEKFCLELHFSICGIWGVVFPFLSFLTCFFLLDQLSQSSCASAKPLLEEGSHVCLPKLIHYFLWFWHPPFIQVDWVFYKKLSFSCQPVQQLCAAAGQIEFVLWHEFNPT